MESWYGDLLGSGVAAAEQELLSDYAPHAGWLEQLNGRVIDIGGGAGLAARFLRPDVDYVVVDPSSVWDLPEWRAFGREFRAAGPQPRFWKAGGEALPFGDGEFDAALALWSLNHVCEPRRCVAELVRVLKPGGVARIVVEDMEPSWSDLARDGGARLGARLKRTYHKARIPMPFGSAVRVKIGGNWPVHPDHIRIAEAELLEWIGSGIKVARGEMHDGSLTFDLAKHRVAEDDYVVS